ncbi:uncharacterized protein LOC126845592 isoform X4 [Adelges cooleyi]|uniref:uncharacterized protein LOC126845592 isoform X4 n=1 Tax=Adelges cooleyi TaxID=133065 RepID=UPI00217F91F7|nr:uncharacterized protein LOC126845592 isoform X4 [Adelges cooleyi]
MDFNNSPLLTIIKEEQDITIVKTEFDSNLDLYNVEKMDLEEDVNRADPFLGFNNNYQASMLKDHTKDINNQIYCPNCGHQFATKFVGSDFVFSKPDGSWTEMYCKLTM